MISRLFSQQSNFVDQPIKMLPPQLRRRKKGADNKKNQYLMVLLRQHATGNTRVPQDKVQLKPLQNMHP